MSFIIKISQKYIYLHFYQLLKFLITKNKYCIFGLA